MAVSVCGEGKRQKASTVFLILRVLPILCAVVTKSLRNMDDKQASVVK